MSHNHKVTTIQITAPLSDRIKALKGKRAAKMKISRLSNPSYLEILIAEEEHRVAQEEKKQNRG